MKLLTLNNSSSWTVCSYPSAVIRQIIPHKISVLNFYTWMLSITLLNLCIFKKLLLLQLFIWSSQKWLPVNLTIKPISLFSCRDLSYNKIQFLGRKTLKGSLVLRNLWVSILVMLLGEIVYFMDSLKSSKPFKYIH